jgi:hypothetical protein
LNNSNKGLTLPENIKEISIHFVSLYNLDKEFFEFDGEINYLTKIKIVKLNNINNIII